MTAFHRVYKRPPLPQPRDQWETDLIRCLQEILDNFDEMVIINVGDVVGTGRSTPRKGFLTCDGAAVSRTQYADLFAAIGTTYGVGDGSTTFNVPDMTAEPVSYQIKF